MIRKDNKRLMITLSPYELKIVGELKKKLETKQLSKVLTYALSYLYEHIDD